MNKVNPRSQPYNYPAQKTSLKCMKTIGIIAAVIFSPIVLTVVIISGITSFFKKKCVKKVSKCSSLGTLGIQVLIPNKPSNHSSYYSPSSSIHSTTPVISPLQQSIAPPQHSAESLKREMISNVYLELEPALIQLKNLKKDKIAQYDLIEETVKVRNVDWEDFITYLDINHSQAFCNLFNAALSKRNKTDITPYLRHLDLDKLGNAIEDKLLLQIDAQTLVLNKNLLSVFIPYFDVKFHFNNNTTNVQFDELDFETFKQVLNNILFDKPTEINGDNLIAWIHASSILDLPSLNPKIEEFLKENYEQIDFKQLIDIFETYSFKPVNVLKAKLQLIMQKTYLELSLKEIEEFLALISFVDNLFLQNINAELIKWLGDNLDNLDLDPFTEIFEKYQLTPIEAIRKKFSILNSLSSLSKEEHARILKLMPFGKEFIKTDWLVDNLRDLGWDNFTANFSENSPLVYGTNTFYEVINKRTKYLFHQSTVTAEDKQELDILTPFVRSFEIADIHPDLYEYFSKMVNLRSLFISKIKDHNLLSHLHSLPELTYLSIRKKLADSDLAKIHTLPKLKTLDANILKNTDQGLAHLASFTELKKLYLRGVAWGFPRLSTNVTGAGLIHLASLPHLEEFLINSDKLTNETIEHISHFPKLKKLSIEGSKAQISGNGLLHLTALTSLKLLRLKLNLNDDDFAFLKDMPNLKKLDFSDCSDCLTPAVFNHIANTNVTGLTIGHRFKWNEIPDNMKKKLGI